MRARDRRQPQGRHRLVGALLALGIGATVAACAGGGSGGAQAGAAPTATVAPANTPTPGGPPTPTSTPLPGAANLSGETDICTAPISVTTTLLPEIPAYNGQLRLAQSNNGNYEYGYCVSASVDTVAAFYIAQLPGKGWQNVQKFTNGSARNIIATRGGERLTITASPDTLQSGDVDLLVIVNNQ